MKNIFILLGCVWFSSFLFSQLPPGTIKIKLPSSTNFIYVDKKPLSTTAWHEYLVNLKNRFGEQSEQFQNALPDTLIWRLRYADQTLFPKTSEAIKDKPVVGLNYNQILDYCDWRTKRVNQKYHRGVHYHLMNQIEFLKVFKNRKLGFQRGDNLVVNVVGKGKERPDTVKIQPNWKVAFQLKKEDQPLNAVFRCVASY